MDSAVKVIEVNLLSWVPLRNYHYKPFLEKLFLIKDQRQTDCVTTPTHALTLTYDLELQSQARYGHDTHKTNSSSRLIGSKDRLETNGETDKWTDGHYRLLYLLS